MDNMKTVTKRQHYLPKSYLDSFSTKCKNSRKVYVLFDNKNRIKFVSIDNICLQKDLYEQKTRDENGNDIYIDRNSIENSFIDIEGKYKTVVNKLDSLQLKSNDAMITVEDREVLSMFMALTIFRNPIFVEMSKQYISRYIELANCNSLNLNFDKISFEVLKSFLSVDDNAVYVPAMKATIMDENAFVLKAKNQKFITSDCPIINLHGEYKNKKFDMIGLPISPDYFFGFIDVVNDFNNRVILIGDEFVDYLNLRQVESKNSKMIISKDDISLSKYTRD